MSVDVRTEQSSHLSVVVSSAPGMREDVAALGTVGTDVESVFHGHRHITSEEQV